MTFRPELMKDYRSPEDLMGESGIVKQLTKALIERCLSAELDHHLAEEKAQPELDRPRNRQSIGLRSIACRNYGIKLRHGLIQQMC